MKTARDPRHVQRIARVKFLFTYSFHPIVDEDIQDIINRLEEIDEKIHAVATERPLDQINKIDLAILRLGVFELITGQKPAVIIDEMVEIAKVYGSDESPDFTHAVLNKVSKQL